MDLLHCKRVIDNKLLLLLRQEEEEEEEEEECNFEPGKHDVSDIFFITPNKLYGRENDLRMLLDTFNKACVSSTNQVVLVTGYAGKYRLVFFLLRYKELTLSINNNNNKVLARRVW